ncbi:MAG: AAA family ATPase, partial [Bacteroidia bacterium]|nr:AAA family ATPase [Bacteroidia bacterium]
IKREATVGFRTPSEEDIYEKMRNRVMEELKRTFRPEFLNRLDETIVFHALTSDHIKEIVSLMLDSVKEHLKEYEITLE